MVDLCTLSGTLRDSAGAPFGNATITLRPVPQDITVTSGGYIVLPVVPAPQVTGPDGTVALQLAPGKHAGSVRDETGRISPIEVTAPDLESAPLEDYVGKIDLVIQTSAQLARDLAQRYAQSPEDTPVAGGTGFSALHHAAKALDAQAAALASAASVQPYASRAAFVAATVPAPVLKTAYADDWGSLSIVRDPTGPITQSNGVKWSPDGIAFIGHFGKNATPGMTDMTTAIEAAAVWSGATSRRVVFPRGDYKITRRCIMPGARFFGEIGARIVASASDFTNADAAVKFTNTSVLFDFSGQLVSPYAAAPFCELVGFDFVFSGTQERRIDPVLARNVAGLFIQNVNFYNFAAGLMIRTDSISQPWQTDNCRAYDCTTSFNLVNSTRENIQISVLCNDADRVNGITSVPGRVTRFEGYRLLQTGAALAAHEEQSDVVNLAAGVGHFVSDIYGEYIGELFDCFASRCSGGNFRAFRAAGGAAKLIHSASNNAFDNIVAIECGRQAVTISASTINGPVENNVLTTVVEIDMDPDLAYTGSAATTSVIFSSAGVYPCRNNIIIGLSTNSPNAKIGITNSGDMATNNAVIGYNFNHVPTVETIRDTSASKSLWVVSSQLETESPSFTTPGQFVSSSVLAGLTRTAAVLANPADTVLNTAVQIEFRPNSAGGIRSAFIRSKQDVAGSHADLSFLTSAGASEVERFRISSAGAVSVLTGPFNVAAGGASVTGGLTVATGNAAVTAGTLTVSTSSGGTTEDILVLRNPVAATLGTGVGIAFQPNDSSSRRASIDSVQDTSGGHADLRFTTAGGATPAERARITSTGTFLVAKTAAGLANGGFEVSTLGRIRSTVSSNLALELNRLASDGQIVSFNREGTQVGSITVTASGTTYATTSDERLKTVLGPAEDSGEVIDAIRIVRYLMTATGEQIDFGVLAQQLFAVFPSAVVVPKKVEDPWQVDMSRAMPLVIAELQYLRARVADLENASA